MKRYSIVFFLFLALMAAPVLGQFEEITISKAGWIPENESDGYVIHASGAYFYKTAGGGYLHHDVNFPASANGKQVTRLSLVCYDNDTFDHLSVRLCKIDRWTGVETEVGYVGTANLADSDSLLFRNQPKSQMTARGIDNSRYSWCLRARFTDGSAELRIFMAVIRFE